MHELHEDEFEKLSADLFSREPGIASCDPYGVRGQRQLGIDLIAHVRNTTDLQVAQCKCYREFPKRKIKQASDEFLKHLDHWRTRKVVRFVLIVAEPLASTGQQQQILIERQRFDDVGIRYEVWSLHALVNRLRPWPDIVERYIDQRRGGHWVDQICGPPPYRLGRVRPSTFGPATPALSIEPAFAVVMQLASEGIARKLDAGRELARKGLHTEAGAVVDGILADVSQLSSLPPAVVAQALRLQASLALDRRGIAEAKRLNAEAFRLHNELSTQLEARIVLEEQGPDACLAYLDGVNSDDEAHDTLRAVCYLRSSRPARAIAVLQDRLASAASADPERLLALALTADGRAAEACQHASAAVAREPQGWATRVALGVVLYYAALSPLAVQGRIPDAPEPCDWSMVRRDDVSRARLRKAAAVFEALHEDRQERMDRETVQAWRLACLLNDAERQDEAAAFCRTALNESATNPHVLEWALARGLAVESANRALDPARACAALSDLLDAGRGDLRHLSVLLSLLSWRGQERRITPTLRRYQSRFATPESGEWYAALEAEVSIRRGQRLPDGLVVDADRAALLSTVQTQDPEEGAARLAALAARLFNSRANDFVLIEALVRLGHLGAVAAVAPYAEVLVSVAGTADAARLAAYAQEAAGRPDAALTVLDGCASLFSGDRLPRDLCRLKASCYHQLGRLDAAIAEMRGLQEVSPAADDALRLADLYVRRGDLSEASAVIASLPKLDSVGASDALRFARVLARHSPDEARRLWRHAARQELAAPLLPLAVTLAQQLSLGPESRTVFERMAAAAVPMTAAADGAPVVALSLDQLQGFLRERQQEIARFERLYEAGTCPVHLLAPQLGWSLPRLMHEAPLERERSGRGGLLLASHGGRQIISQLPPSPRDWCLHLDVTALLMAAHLDILDTVERCFRPMHISSHLVPALLEMQSGLLDGDDDALDGARDLLRLVSSGRIATLNLTEWDGALTSAVAVGSQIGAVAVVWYDAAADLDWQQAPVANLSAVVSALARSGALVAEREADIRARLGTAGDEPPIGRPPAPGESLFFHANTIECVAVAGMLDDVCATWKVSVEPALVADLTSRIAGYRARAATAVWVGRLIDRLNAGIQDGTYVLLPISMPTLDELGSRDLTLASLLDLLRLPPASGNAVWMDDRALTAYSACGAAALVNVPDMLAALRHYGHISDDAFFRALLRLRAGGVAFIPPVEGEVTFWLRQAAVTDGRLAETRELSVLRRYVARCFAQESILQLPPLPAEAPNPHGEVAFAIGWTRAIGETLRAMWSDPGLGEDRVLACSRWLVESLGMQRFERLPVHQPTPEGRRAILISGLSGLLCNGFLLLGCAPGENDRFRRYMCWVGAEVIEPRLRADPALERPLAEMLAAFLAAPSADRGPDALLVQRHLTARFLDGLPERLKPHAAGHTALQSALGMRLQMRVLQVGRFSFEAEPYFSAVVQALGGTPVDLRAESGELCQIAAAWEDGHVVIRMQSGGGGLVVTDRINDLLGGETAAAECLANSPAWLDVPSPERKRQLDRLLAISDVTERVLKAIDLRAGTALAFYTGLEQRVHAGLPVAFADLEPPSAGALLDYLRLGAEGPFADRLSAAARELIDDHGLDEAFARLGGIPTELPAPIRDGLSNLSGADRRATLERWQNFCPSPIHRIHVARQSELLGSCIAERDATDRSSGWSFGAQGDGWMETFASLLRAFGWRSADWCGARGLAPADRIAICWAHAGEVFRVVGPFVDVDELRAITDRYGGESLSAAFADERGYRADVACPQYVRSEMLAVVGLAFVVAGRSAADLCPEERALVRRLAAQTIDGTLFPAGWVLEPRFLRSDATGSFLATSLADVVSRAGLDDIAVWCSEENQEALLQHGLDSAGRSGGGLNGWQLVLSMARFCTLPQRMQGAFCAPLTRTVGFDPAAEPAFTGDLLRFVARQSVAADLVEVQAAATALYEAAFKASAVEGIEPATVQTLLRASIDLSRDRQGQFQTQVFARACGELCEASEGAAAAVRRFVFHAVQQLPFADAENLWPILVQVRAL